MKCIHTTHTYYHIIIDIAVRSTPFEVLHTVLLGPYKYLLKATIRRLSTEEKNELLARLRGLNYSGMDYRVTGNIVHHHKSFVGRDYKALAQFSIYVLGPYLQSDEVAVWVALSEGDFLFCTLLAFFTFFAPGVSHLL